MNDIQYTVISAAELVKMKTNVAEVIALARIMAADDPGTVYHVCRLIPVAEALKPICEVQVRSI